MSVSKKKEKKEQLTKAQKKKIISRTGEYRGSCTICICTVYYSAAYSMYYTVNTEFTRVVVELNLVDWP